MDIGLIRGHTRVIGASQGYLGLPLRDVTLNCSVNGEDTPAMESAWFPSRDEVDRIAAGEPIILRILGTQHPPVMLLVGS